MSFCRARAPWPAALTLMVSGCTMLLDFDGALQDGAPPADVTLPVPDADPIAPDAPPAPAERFEPNDRFSDATRIEPGSYGPLAIFPVGDHDYFTFTLDFPRDLVVRVLFAQIAGDLDLKLYDATLAQIASAEGFVSNEELARRAATGNQLAAGMYFVEVYGFNNANANASYILELELP